VRASNSENGPALDPGPRRKRALAFQVPQRLGFPFAAGWLTGKT